MRLFLLSAALVLGARTAFSASPESEVVPPLTVGPGYYAILPNKLLLASKLNPPFDRNRATLRWSKESGPGDVRIERPDACVTWASATVPGKYVFRVKVGDGQTSADATTSVNVYPASEKFGNPILPGMFPDPHVMSDNGKFYIYSTSMENQAGGYGRASVWMSDDFVHWHMKLTNWPAYGKFGGDIWAPDIIRMGKRFYQFITRSGGYDTWIGVADHPDGPWENLRNNNTPIVSGGGNAGRIVPAYNMDSQPFIDDDGQAYMYWGWAESMAAKLTPDLKEIDGDVHFLKGTKWLPNGGTLPQWWSVDLGMSMPVTRVVTCPEFRHVAYGYKIELSDDNKSWEIFADRNSNTTVKAGDGYTDTGIGQGRYLRITMNSCQGNWAGLYDCSVFSGDRLVSLNMPASASSMRGPGTEPAKAVDASNGPQLADFVEGSYMLKHSGTYYLLYSSGALHDGSYCVRYSMAKTPFGPFATPANNIVLQSNTDQTTRGPGHNSVLKFNGRHYIVYHQHNQPHQGGALVFRQTCADLLEFNPDGTIKPVVPTQTGIGALQPLVPEDNDLARGKYASATSELSGAYVAGYALDHNNASLWRAADNTYPQALTVDLGGSFDIARIETSFEYPTLSYRYAIETSLDGKSWQPYADKTTGVAPVVCPQEDVQAARSAFVRITVYACERPENAAGIYNFKVFGPHSPSVETSARSLPF